MEILLNPERKGCGFKNRPLSVNSQSGGQNNRIVLHFKGLILLGDRTTIVLSSRLGITEMGLYPDTVTKTSLQNITLSYLKYFTLYNMGKVSCN